MDSLRTNTKKRKSRFSDVPTTQININDIPKDTIDPVALAKQYAAKISNTIPKTQDIDIVNHNQLQDEQTRIAREKKLRTEQIYKSVQAQMTQIQALLKKPTTDKSISGFRPAPLLLDEQGRQIDADGNLISTPVPGPVATLKANQQKALMHEKESHKHIKQSQNPYLSHRTVEAEDEVESIDPRLKIKKRETRGSKSLSFVKQGTFVKQGEQIRAREAKKMMAGFTSGRNPRGYHQESIDPSIVEMEKEGTIGSNTPMDVDIPLQPTLNTPIVEWWDIEYLPKDKRQLIDRFGFYKHSVDKSDSTEDFYTSMKLKYCGTAHLIEHPAKIDPIGKRTDSEPVVLPLMLTAVERKKIRRQQRAEREKEKQDKIALGLLPPPEPKVKLSNMMRVLGEKAVADPSAIERQVRQQIAQREKNHEMRNLARKLTPEERREKKLRKIKEDAAGEIHVAVFKVADLSNEQHRFKVDVNAQQYHLTGGVVLCKDENINLVVVEGGKKAVKHYTKLMLRRIDWTGERENDGMGDVNNDDEQDNRSKGCKLVWQGVVARKAFNHFRFQECRTSVAARRVMETKNVVHYWDLVEKTDMSSS